eukprot:TRINITY_DN2612_c0_g1_i2.p1 TRINITY_DN2612_c0_g1~~TRINITY_DN2612_c0_g1_i2.p1  ORF type:complete len:347 (-),score=64.25 TRINITY_DN2612_c0_g1_i2:37-1077(-)
MNSLKDDAVFYAMIVDESAPVWTGVSCEAWMPERVQRVREWQQMWVMYCRLSYQAASRYWGDCLGRWEREKGLWRDLEGDLKLDVLTDIVFKVKGVSSELELDCEGLLDMFRLPNDNKALDLVKRYCQDLLETYTLEIDVCCASMRSLDVYLNDLNVQTECGDLEVDFTLNDSILNFVKELGNFSLSALRLQNMNLEVPEEISYTQYVYLLPETIKKTVQELQRRKEFKQKIIEYLKDVTRHLNTVLLSEQKKRENFDKRCKLPRELLDLLPQTLPQINISMEDFGDKTIEHPFSHFERHSEDSTLVDLNKEHECLLSEQNIIEMHIELLETSISGLKSLLLETKS